MIKKNVLHQVEISMSEKKLRLVHFKISDENEARKMALLHHVMQMFARLYTSYSTGGVM